MDVNDAMMQLFGSYTSPYVRHCRVALLQEQEKFEFVEIDYSASAAQSPMARVPFLRHGQTQLTDSSSILKYVREQGGHEFLGTAQEFELFAMSNTVLDTAINLFLMERDGATPDTLPYLARQQARISNGLAALEERIDPEQVLSTDSGLRCACLLAWGLFRHRFRLDGLHRLNELLARANADPLFAATAPPTDT